MILQALYNYYQILLNDPPEGVEIAEPGYSNAPVSYALNLSEQGELLDIIPLFVPVQQGKKTVELPKRMNVPEQVKRSVNIAANFLCDNATYVLGLTGKEAKDPDYAQKRFEAFRERNVQLLQKADSPAAHAVIAFLQKYNPKTASQHSVIARHLEGLLEGGNLIFQVEGKNALDDTEIRRAWENSRTGQQTTEMQCLVTGQKELVARLHPDIKGVPGAQTKGASLVSFNLDAFTSYGKEQGANSPISQRVASGYGVALNYLLSRQNPNQPIFLGDTAVVYWADAPDKRYASAFYSFLNPEYQQEQEEGKTEEAHDKNKRKRANNAEKMLGEVAKSVEQGRAIDLAKLREDLDDNTRFYVLGLAPNASRLAVRFFLTEPFGVFAERIMQHYEDLQIEKEYANQPTYISPYRILAECVSPKVTQRDEEVKKSWSLLGGAFMRSILMGTPYPENLYNAILNRIRHDGEETTANNRVRSVKINYIRTAYIKAHLIRKYRRYGKNPYQEVLQMSLNESYKNTPYVLGRLFAVLEKVQKEAIGDTINATIKDRYFTAACATPASVFPTLLRLSNYWTSKAEYGGASDRKIQTLLNMLDAAPFPARLNLEEQGIFVLGYYHQKAAFYKTNSNLNE
ncbi:type I-C CRISPR-associated protein Cas8c/Csd1 [Treponema sp. J25]|uniref:type I-C CRISPR-associated protein Cas8c/Csd1 n=1 Tax=Treponema sp. J25 TaxID=2094121 RepID=UPI001046C342|nr:type I-C CRISPR-associated protein Cas8c/Csd1 [Treponema sp. J25]TCW62115.1 type I-C CRISPR-associated protein Cas8c/Csd1 [Treponema sp. J25]